MTLFARESDKEWMDRSLKTQGSMKIYHVSNYYNLVMVRNFKVNGADIEPVKPDPFVKNALMTACNRLNVDYPGTDLEHRLSYEITKSPSSLYMTGYFDPKSKSRLQIKGPEAWIVEIFVEKLTINTKNLTLFPVYLYSEDMGCWCQLNNKYKWIHIIRPPRPSDNYIGISSDPISVGAKLEISLL